MLRAAYLISEVHIYEGVPLYFHPVVPSNFPKLKGT